MGLGRGESIWWLHRNKIFCNSSFNLTHLTLNLTLWKINWSFNSHFHGVIWKYLILHNYGRGWSRDLKWHSVSSKYGSNLKHMCLSNEMKRDGRQKKNKWNKPKIPSLLLINNNNKNNCNYNNNNYNYYYYYYIFLFRYNTYQTVHKF